MTDVTKQRGWCRSVCSDSHTHQADCGALSVSRMSSMRTILNSTLTVGAVGVGYGIWSLISPGEDRRKALTKNLPEANPMRMEETRMRNALVMQALKDAAETSDNIARGK